jgi:predicted nucleotidyltransferase
MSRTFLDVSGRVPTYEPVIREIDRLTSSQGTAFFVVGALARDIIMEVGYGIKVKRATADLDCGIRVESWEGFQLLWDALIKTNRFKPDPRQRQRVIFESGLMIDIVPFGPIDQDEGVIRWPPEEEMEMSTLGLEEAYAHALNVRLADDLEVIVSSPSGLALMKIFAWKERRHRYTKDALDLGFIMSNYIYAGNTERVYGEGGDANDLLKDFDNDLSSARLLGRDVGRLLTPNSQIALMQILEGQTGERNEYPLVETMIRENYQGKFEVGLAALEMLKIGILEST